MADEQKKTFQLQRVYLKDASFECPGAPDIFLQEWKPKMNVQLNNGARQCHFGCGPEISTSQPSLLTSFVLLVMSLRSSWPGRLEV